MKAIISQLAEEILKDPIASKRLMTLLLSKEEPKILEFKNQKIRIFNSQELDIIEEKNQSTERK